MVSRVHALLPASYDWSGADGKPGASEDRRERAEVQRSYYAFLNALAQSRLLQCLQASQMQSCQAHTPLSGHLLFCLS